MRADVGGILRGSCATAVWGGCRAGSRCCPINPRQDPERRSQEPVHGEGRIQQPIGRAWTITTMSRLGLDLLCDHGWIAPIELETGGRPRTEYAINPKVRVT